MSHRNIYDEEQIREIVDNLSETSDLEDEEEDNIEFEEDSDDSVDDPDFCISDEDEVEEEQFRQIECAEKRKVERNTPKRRKVNRDNDSTSSITKVPCEPFVIVPEEHELIGKNGFVWKTTIVDFESSKTPSKNIVHIRPGPTKQVDPDPEKCLNLFLTDNILEEIVLHTNEEIERQRQNYRVMKATVSDICKEELKAYIGLLILCAGLKDNTLSAKLLFDPNYCGDRYRATMSRERFIFLTNCLRFDDKETREQRKSESKLAPIENIWNIFVSNCVSNYKPSSYCTIDEQLVGFRGACPFRIYMSNKPNKYGLKIVMICDNATKYMINAMPYLGKGTTPKGYPVADYFVEQLVKTMKGTNRNITMDNWFMSVPLALKLQREYGLTCVGTIKKNKRELPIEFTDLKYKQREVNTSLFLYADNVTAVSYKPKTNKLVTLISTMHDEGCVHNSTKKPEIILTYNQTKGAVDTLDQMCSNRGCNRKTRRWPMCMFYNILSIATINSHVIYVHQFYKQRTNTSQRPLSRMNFLLELHKMLTRPWQEQRLTVPRLPTDLKTTIQKILEKAPEKQDGETTTTKGKRKYCNYCHYSKRRFTTTYCATYQKPICGEHQKKICPTGC